MSETFGEEIRQRRERLRMSQSDLARLAGISRNTIVNVERGIGQSEKGTVKALREALDAAENGNPVALLKPADPVRELIARTFDALVDALSEDLVPPDSMNPEAAIAIRATRRAYLNAARIARGEDL